MGEKGAVTQSEKMMRAITTNNPTCRTCPYADEIDDPKGICRAEPPAIIPYEYERDGYHEIEYHSFWPEINADTDWCGKHPGRRVPLVVRVEQ